MQKTRGTTRILLAGSSHTQFLFPYVRKSLEGLAEVKKLPSVAGTTREILRNIGRWGLEGTGVVHLYAGHRDLAPELGGASTVPPGEFERNLGEIVDILLVRSEGIVVVSTIPPVSEGLLGLFPDRNRNIGLYNGIIISVTSERGVPVHDFARFVGSRPGGDDRYIDGLHLTRKLYKEYAGELAEYLMSLLRDG